jgi:hypothetical protein
MTFILILHLQNRLLSPFVSSVIDQVLCFSEYRAPILSARLILVPDDGGNSLLRNPSTNLLCVHCFGSQDHPLQVHSCQTSSHTKSICISAVPRFCYTSRQFCAAWFVGPDNFSRKIQITKLYCCLSRFVLLFRLTHSLQHKRKYANK